MVPDGKGGLGPSSNDPIAQAAEREPERTIRATDAADTWGEEQLAVLEPAPRRTPAAIRHATDPGHVGAADKDLRERRRDQDPSCPNRRRGQPLRDNLAFNPNKRTIANFIGTFFKPMGIRIHMIFFTPAANQRNSSEPRETSSSHSRRSIRPAKFSLAKNLRELIHPPRGGDPAKANLRDPQAARLDSGGRRAARSDGPERRRQVVDQRSGARDLQAAGPRRQALRAGNQARERRADHRRARR